MTELCLNGVWTLKNCATGKTWQAAVPGSVMTTLLAAGDAPDPFYGTNELVCKEMLRDDFSYETKFTVSDAFFSDDTAQLVFEGVDTIADITLNGTRLARVNDMHRTHCIPVAHLLCKGENTLCVTLFSALAFVEAADKSSDIFYASTGCMHGNGYLRKAHYMFGWDWGPVVPDMGLFRSVRLQCGARITDVCCTQTHENGAVTLHGTVEFSAQDTQKVTLEVMLTAPDGKETTLALRCAQGNVGFVHTVEKPELWWPNGYGAQPLYTLRCRLLQSGQVLHERAIRLGLRELFLSSKPDAYGMECAFCVNGVKIFAMGANYIPQDNILPRVNEENTRRLLADSTRANFNCIRVWGGGYYPDDFFYDLCDEYGLIIWQDLMFACNVYDLTENFEQNILAETRDAVRRLRHHACLGVWCGNNEMEWGWRDWGRLEGHRPKYKADYIKIFEMLLPRCVQALDSQTSYWLSSPSSGGSFDDPNSFTRGDNHYWEVWHSGKPFTEYKSFYFRFCSEFGFQSFPGIKTIRSFCPSDEENIFSRTMESHQKNGMANQKIFTYISEYFRYPKDMENIAYISQILQLKAIQYGVEHWRRNFGRCMGSLYWQLNDCWPVASWASIDYYGRWKALHYGAKRFYARCTASACEEQELSPRIAYYVHNETLTEKKLTLCVTLSDMNLTVLHTHSQSLTLMPCTVHKACQLDFTPYLPAQRDNVFAAYELFENETSIAAGTTLFAKPKHIHLPLPHLHVDIEEGETAYTLSLTSDKFAHYVEIDFAQIDAVLSDNYFDITSTAPKIVRLEKQDIHTPAVTRAMLYEQLRLKTVAHSY